MKKIIITSKNPVKIQATLDGFQKVFPLESFQIEGVSVPSGVSDQPMSSQETLQGAQQRANNAYTQYSGADFWIGIEGGVEEQDKQLAAFAWICIRSLNKTGKAKTGTFYLPNAVTQLIREGKELGEADDIVFQQSNSKKQNGAVGLLTQNLITRTSLYEHAVILALIPFNNPHY